MAVSALNRKLSIVIALSFPFASLQADESVRQRILAEAPAGWKALEDYYRHSEGEFHVSWRIPGLPKRDETVAFKVNGDLLRTETILRQEQGEELHLANLMNRSASFQFERSDSNSPYKLKRVVQVIGRPAYMQQFYEHLQWLHAPYSDADISLCSWLSEEPFVFSGPGFTLEYSSTRLGRAELIADANGWIEFDLESEIKVVKRSKNLSGQIPEGPSKSTIVVDPANSWSIQEIKGSINIEYEGQDEGIPLLKRITQGGRTVEFKRLARALIPESEFTLTAFGLPEMALPSDAAVAERSQGWLWILLAIAVGATVLAVLTRIWLIRRKAASPV